MMGPRQVEQAALFYEFSLDAHVPGDHLLRLIDRFVDLSEQRRELAPFYSAIGRPSIDPELMIRMLIVGYCFVRRTVRNIKGLQVAKGQTPGKTLVFDGDVWGTHRFSRAVPPFAAPRLFLASDEGDILRSARTH